MVLFSFFESVNFPVLGSKLGYFWTIFKGFGDIIDDKYMFYLSKFYENLRVNFIWSENVNSDVKLKILYSFESQSNQNDFHILSIFSFNSQNFQNLSYQKLWITVLNNLVRQNFKILIIEWVVWVRGPCRFRWKGDQNYRILIVNC